jgi:hypothetical protein
LPKQIESYWEILKPFFEAIDTGGSTEAYAASLGKVPRAVVLLYATHMCLAEVHNGGLLQFFWNSTGIVAPETIEGFAAIGMPKLGSLVKQAASLLGDPYPRDRDARWDALLAASDCSPEYLERLFAKAEGFYLAFAEATESLGFEALNKSISETANTENGGFQERATCYAREAAVH